jgi:hypothetical protein
MKRVLKKIAAGFVIIVAALCASACATTQQVPVAVSCVHDRPARPAFRTDNDILTLGDYDAILALRAERLKAQAYIGELEDVVEVCDGAPSVVAVPR